MKPQACVSCNTFKTYIRKGLCKGCYFKQNPDKYLEHKSRVKNYATTDNGKFLNAKSQAKERGIQFSLTKEEYFSLIKNNCDYCNGILPNKGTGLDRINNNLGYTLLNVVPCCTSCNSIKGIYLTYEEMKVAMQAVLEFRKNVY